VRRAVLQAAPCALSLPAASGNKQQKKKKKSPLPIEFITLAHGAISFGSDIDMQWNPIQRAFVGIGLVLFQLTSEWNWLAGVPWQAADLDGNSETMFCASNEVSVKVFEEYSKRVIRLCSRKK
jgi:hypothetical protein